MSPYSNWHIAYSGMRGDVVNEWDGTKQHDVVFLLTINPPDAHRMLEIRKEAEAAGGKGAQPSPDKLYGLVRVRGCEVVEVTVPRKYIAILSCY